LRTTWFVFFAACVACRRSTKESRQPLTSRMRTTTSKVVVAVSLETGRVSPPTGSRRF
jgi:hypothetical protein